MEILVLALVAGMLTALAPCVLPVLPVMIGGSAQGEHRRPWLLALSLGVSVIGFTLLLKVSTVFINIPSAVWNVLSGIIILSFGLSALFPSAWTWLSTRLGFQTTSDELLERAATKHGLWGDILLGASLGPVFSSCSPTYFLILATVLPASFGLGLLALVVYTVGMCGVLLAVSWLGQALLKRVRFAVNPYGWFRRGLGCVFVILGLAIIFGFTQSVQTFLLNHGFDPTKLEIKFQTALRGGTASSGSEIGDIQLVNEGPYHEIVDPGGYVNTDGIKLGDLIGKKVIIVDFMTYSCINCIRTFPYLNDWYAKYHDDGLEIVGIHTPEFAFEHKQENVAKAMEKYGILFPVVLDNNYGTWNAYANEYWPRKYIIDLNGNIVFDHIGEGGYAETEAVIRQLLGLPPQTADTRDAGTPTGPLSPETYFGAARNGFLVTGVSGQPGEQTLATPTTTRLNGLSLGGTWNFLDEYAQSQTAEDSVLYRFQAGKVFLVASADQPVRVRVTVDGQPVAAAHAGEDVTLEAGGDAVATIGDERLYSLVAGYSTGDTHVLRLEPETPGLKAYTFTFGD